MSDRERGTIILLGEANRVPPECQGEHGAKSAKLLGGYRGLLVLPQVLITL